MSGGVDSSVAAYLLKQQDYICSGATMKLFSDIDTDDTKEKSCCSLRDVKDARSVANELDIPYFVYNFSDEFNKQVIERFVKAYIEGATPNPCIDCNRFIKFDKLLLRARQLEIDYLATGHYARIEYNNESGRFLLKKALDTSKDQSYFLYAMTQTQLAHTLFPLGTLSKPQVREIAQKMGFKNADKQDSQDICFVQDRDYGSFIEQYTGEKSKNGDYIDLKGNILGSHKGIIRYTIGQRRGLAIALNKPMYVHSKDTKNNTVTLCEDGDLFEKSLLASDFNWIAIKSIDTPIRIKAKIRYNQEEQWAMASQVSHNTVKIEFDEPQRAMAKGQAAVLYDGDIVVGGGTIS